MNQYLFFIGDYLKGKPVYPTFRRVLNLLFSISLTSFLFEKFYFKYSWLDITDYKSILNFFIKGNFFVPFSLFIIIHYFLDWLSDTVFTLSTMKKTSKIIKKIWDYQFSKSDYKAILEKTNDNPVVDLPEAFNKSYILSIYDHLVKSIPAEQWTAMEKALDDQKRSTQESFKLAFKALVTITIYFITIPYFGWILYSLVLVVLTFILIGLYYGYLLMEIVPSAIRRFHIEVIKYLQSIKKDEN